MRQRDFLGALIHTAYFPAELPPTITTKFFSKYCQNEYASLSSRGDNLLKLSTKYDTFTAPRQDLGRRSLALVHPLGQIALCLVITKNKKKIIDLLNGSSNSVYSIEQSPTENKAFKGLDFGLWRERRNQMLTTFPYVMKADISRFFYTVYTHSIPWAVLGKAKAKDWHFHHKSKLNNHWSSKFDRALQACQDRETFGIPVGPDTSRLIAEILLSGLAKHTKFGTDFSSVVQVRLIDDFLMGFETEAQAHTSLNTLRTSLWTYSLQLNEAKSSVIPTRLIYDDPWKVELAGKFISSATEYSEKRDISSFVDLSLRLCADTKSAAPADWCCKRLCKLPHHPDNFGVILSALLRLARDFPTTISYVCSYIINHQGICREAKWSSMISAGLKRLVKIHSHHNNDLEIAWCLLASSVLKVTWSKSDFQFSSSLPNSIVFSVIGLLKENGLFLDSLAIWPWKKEFKRQGIMGQNWLPFYESVRRKWTSDTALIRAVRSDPTLDDMLNNDVTFLDPDALRARHIDLKKRTFVKDKGLAERQEPNFNSLFGATTDYSEI